MCLGSCRCRTEHRRTTLHCVRRRVAPVPSISAIGDALLVHINTNRSKFINVCDERGAFVRYVNVQLCLHPIAPASATSVVTERPTTSEQLAMNLREPDAKLTINIPYTCVPYVLAVSTSSICLYVASVPRIRALAPRCCRLAQTHDGSSGQVANTRTESPLLARVATTHTGQCTGKR